MGGLSPGVSLGEAYSQSSPAVPQVRVSEATPASSPSSSGPSLLPPGSRTPSSGSAASERPSVGSDARPAPRPVRTLPARTSAYRSRRVELSPDTVADSPATSPPSTDAAPVVHSAPAARSTTQRAVVVKPAKACLRCKNDRKGCSYPAGADTVTSDCARCIQAKAKCVWPIDLGPVVAGGSFSLFFPSPSVLLNFALAF